MNQKSKNEQRTYTGKKSMIGRTCLPLPRYKFAWDKVLCFQPIYLPDGLNGCRIYYAGDITEDIPHTIDWVLADWCSYHLTSIPILHQQSLTWLGSSTRRRLPLVMKRELCLIPVKFRTARKRNDSVSGYAVLHKIKYAYQQADGKTCLTFHDNAQTISVLEKHSTLIENMCLGQRLIQYFDREH